MLLLEIWVVEVQKKYLLKTDQVIYHWFHLLCPTWTAESTKGTSWSNAAVLKIVGKKWRTHPIRRRSQEPHSSSSAVVFRGRDNPAVSWNDTPLKKHSFTPRRSSTLTSYSLMGLSIPAALNKNHIICQCLKRYFNKGKKKGEVYQTAPTKADNLMSNEEVPEITQDKLTPDPSHDCYTWGCSSFSQQLHLKPYTAKGKTCITEKERKACAQNKMWNG